MREVKMRGVGYRNNNYNLLRRETRAAFIGGSGGALGGVYSTPTLGPFGAVGAAAGAAVGAGVTVVLLAVGERLAVRGGRLAVVVGGIGGAAVGGTVAAAAGGFVALGGGTGAVVGVLLSFGLELGSSRPSSPRPSGFESATLDEEVNPFYESLNESQKTYIHKTITDFLDKNSEYKDVIGHEEITFDKTGKKWVLKDENKEIEKGSWVAYSTNKSGVYYAMKTTNLIKCFKTQGSCPYTRAPFPRDLLLKIGLISERQDVQNVIEFTNVSTLLEAQEIEV
jgi:hypothetical protein